MESAHGMQFIGDKDSLCQFLSSQNQSSGPTENSTAQTASYYYTHQSLKSTPQVKFSLVTDADKATLQLVFSSFS